MPSGALAASGCPTRAPGLCKADTSLQRYVAYEVRFEGVLDLLAQESLVLFFVLCQP